MFNALQVASLFATLDLRDNATQGLRSFDNSLSRTGDRISRFGAGMRNVGLSITAATAPLVAFGVQGVQTAANFEMAMATIQARTRLTDEAMDEMRRMALRLGADTAFSAQQAADAMLELLSSGNSAEETLAMLPAVLDAAAASGEDLGRVADDVTNILATFALDAEYAAEVVDALAQASGSSSATMGDLGQAFANVGSMARMYGLDVEETAAIFAIFAENGIKGAEAGTQLRSMLREMGSDTASTRAAWEELGVSLYDADGNIRDLNVVFGELREALSSLPMEDQNRLTQQLFGSFGILGGSALIAAGGTATMVQTMQQAASATDIAAQRMDTFNGRMDALQGSIETLQIQALTPLMEEGLSPLVEQVTGVTNRITEWATQNPETAKTVIFITGVAAALGAGLAALGIVVSLVGAGIGALGAVIAAIASPIGLAIAAVAALGAAVATNFLGIRDRINEAINTLRNFLSLWNVQMAPAGGTPVDRVFGGLYDAGRGRGFPGRAGGGMMSAGMPYVVGERGPELVIPDRSAYVMANHAMGGANVTITLNVTEGNARNAGMNFAMGLQERMRAMG